jgi:hypothetical protein
MKNITIKDKILYLLLPFIISCSTATATTPKAKSQEINKVKISGYSQLDHTEPAIEPDWLRKTPKEGDAFYFVGMSARRSERKDAKNESFNDAMIAFARYCGLNVSVIEEHKDVSIGGNGGVIDTLTQGNSFAKMRAELYMGNVTTEDRYLERYSNFHGGSFMGHSFVVSTLIKVPRDEMETCRANRKTANTYIEEQSETIAKLSKKNETLENRIQVVERNNQTLAMNQVVQSNKLFEQIKNKKQKRKSVAKKVVNKTPEKLVSNNKPTTNKPTTRLMWQKEAFDYHLNWYGAVEYCKNLDLEGFNDWTLPEKGDYPDDSRYEQFWTLTDETKDKSKEYSVRCVRGEKKILAVIPSKPESLEMARPHIDEHFSHFTVYQNHTYALTNKCVTWSIAKNLSKEFNSYPVKIEGNEENEFIANYFYNQLNDKINKVSGYTLRIGLTDLSSEGDWRWFDNSNPLFTNWALNGPNDYGSGEDFAEMIFKNKNPKKKLGTWNDGPGTSEFGNCKVTIFEWDYMVNWEDNNNNKIVSFNN